MAFNGVGFFFIGAGVTFRLAFTFGFPPNGDRGAQCFSAQPLTTTARLVRVSQDKTFGTNGIFVYGFTVANAGPAAAFFNVQGGGYI